MTNTLPLVSIIIVSWNTRDLLRDCLKSIDAQKGSVNVEVIVVDNASTDGSAEMVRKEFPHVTLLPQTENLGFTRGNNVGFAAATGEVLFLLNPDTTLVGNALETLVTVLLEKDDVGAVGPLLRFPNGNVQSTGNKVPTTDVLFTVQTPAPRVVFKLVGRWHLPLTTERREVGWVSGAALMVKRTVYEKIGGLDEQFFMYFEETDWQTRMHQAGWRVLCVPTAEVIHHADAAGKQVSAWTTAQFDKSRVLYTRKWKGRVMAELLRWWLIVLYGYKIAEVSITRLFRTPTPLDDARRAAYQASIKALPSTTIRTPFNQPNKDSGV